MRGQRAVSLSRSLSNDYTLPFPPLHSFGTLGLPELSNGPLTWSSALPAFSLSQRQQPIYTLRPADGPCAGRIFLLDLDVAYKATGRYVSGSRRESRWRDRDCCKERARIAYKRHRVHLLRESATDTTRQHHTAIYELEEGLDKRIDGSDTINNDQQTDLSARYTDTSHSPIAIVLASAAVLFCDHLTPPLCRHAQHRRQSI